MKLALLDMDGTLSDDRHRKPLYVPGQYSDYWDRDQMLADPAFPEALRTIEDLRAQGWSIGILSARSAKHNVGVTKEWLADKGISYDYMWLKPEESAGVAPQEFKTDVMRQLIHQYAHLFDKVVLFDNDPRVVHQVATHLGSEHVVHCTWEVVLDPA